MDDLPIKQHKEILDYITLLKTNNDIIACYYQGSIKEFIPKVSDIDLLIITKNKINEHIFLSKIPPTLDLTLYPEDIWYYGFCIKPLFEGYLQPIFEKFSLPSIFDINIFDKKLIYLSHILDYSYITFFTWLHNYTLQILNNKRVNIKEFLKRINGLKYLVMMYNYIKKEYITTEPFTSFFNNINEIRLKDYNKLDLKILHKIIYYAYSEILFNLLKGVVEYIKDNIIKDCYLQNLYYINGRNFYAYKHDFFSKFDSNNWLNKMNKLHNNIIILPSELSFDLIYYSKQNGIISDKIKRHLTKVDIYPDISFDYLNILKHKYYILEKWAKYIMYNKVRVGFRPFEYRYTNTLRDEFIEFYFNIKSLYQNYQKMIYKL